MATEFHYQPIFSLGETKQSIIAYKRPCVGKRI